MDDLFLMNIFPLHPGLKMSFEHHGVRKNLFLSACFCWDSRLSLREMEQKLNLVEPLVMETRTWTLHFATPKYSDNMQYYAMLPEPFDYKPVKDPATATWLVEVQTVVCLVT